MTSEVIFSKGLKYEFERVVVNEPSVFEPLKFYVHVVTYLQDIWSLSESRLN